jgi:lipoprotein signal peptidase
MKQKTYYIGGSFLVLLLVAFDQYTKYLATQNLKGQESFVLIKNVFSLHYLENVGAAFGLFENQRIFFIISTAIILCLIIYFFVKTPKIKRYQPMLFTLLFVVAGAIGNCIDRIWLGYVVDFFYFELIDFPVFNVADCYIVVALFVFSFLLLFYYKEEELTFFSLKQKEESDV